MRALIEVSIYLELSPGVIAPNTWSAVESYLKCRLEAEQVEIHYIEIEQPPTYYLLRGEDGMWRSL